MGVHPPPSPAWVNFSIMMECTVRQKAAVAALCVLCELTHSGEQHVIQKKSDGHDDEHQLPRLPIGQELNPMKIENTKKFSKNKLDGFEMASLVSPSLYVVNVARICVLLEFCKMFTVSPHNK